MLDYYDHRIFIARYLKPRLGKWWFRCHIFFTVGITGIATIVGASILLFDALPFEVHAHSVGFIAYSINPRLLDP